MLQVLLCYSFELAWQEGNEHTLQFLLLEPHGNKGFVVNFQKGKLLKVSEEKYYPLLPTSPPNNLEWSMGKRHCTPKVV